jgi:hypothetical protein
MLSCPKGKSFVGEYTSLTRNCKKLENKKNKNRNSEGLVSKSSCFLGDPPPDPRFLASLGALSPVKLLHCLD